MPHQALFLLLLAISHAALLTTSGAPPPAPERNSNCPDKCGDVHIPYPFGIGPGCYLNPSFNLSCDETTTPPTLRTGNIKIASITLETAKMVAYNYLTFSCKVPGHDKPWTQTMSVTLSRPFLVSPSDNVFTALGCSSIAKLTGRGDDAYFTGCITTCKNVNNTEDDGTPCAGHGCCEASLTPGLDQVSVSWDGDEKGDQPVVAGNLCQYAFVAKKDWYNFSRKDLIGNMTFGNRLGLGNVVPIVLDWAIREGTCPPVPEGVGKETVPYGACLSNHSYCVNASNGEPGYFCNCSMGYNGNPYIKNGCTNIDECALRRSPNSTVYENMYPCRGGTCHDREGYYKCKCNFGRKGDGKSERGCEPILPTAAVAAIGTVSALALLSVILIFLQMEREKRKLRERFNKNGGQLLKSIKIEIFTKEKLDHMTNNYSCIIGRGAFGQVYKGATGAGDGGTRVAVKRSIAINEERQKDFANEITIQSKISHRNLVQLLGCCLESEVPMLVYEFVPRGSLQDVLHGKNEPLPLETRLNIGIYPAVALGYMHSEASQRTIVLHGDVKSGNILLDEDFTPKVSDFGTSRLMSMDKDHTNWVIGDSSYIDPVYMKTGLLTDKSDVYSFGIVLLELVTRKKARYDGNKSLPLDYVKATVDGTAREMLDKEIVAGGEENVKCLEEVGRIAVQCLEDEVDDRPTMSKVAEKLKECKTRWMECHGKAE
uniref:Uncharacterized protein n=1 Tax=Avena sativa TaxID=4498 RepID=A0ACD5YD72_AVESA